MWCQWPPGLLERLPLPTRAHPPPTAGPRLQVPAGPKTFATLRNNINVCILYMAAWIGGTGEWRCRPGRGGAAELPRFVEPCSHRQATLRMLEAAVPRLLHTPQVWKGPLIAAGGYKRDSAIQAVASGGWAGATSRASAPSRPPLSAPLPPFHPLWEGPPQATRTRWPLGATSSPTPTCRCACAWKLRSTATGARVSTRR